LKTRNSSKHFWNNNYS